MSSGNGGSPRGPEDPARARIAAATVFLVGSRGYAQTSIEAICEQARTRRSHFDRCFAGKEDCFLSVHDEVCAEFCERVQAAHAGASSWHDRVWAAGWGAMRFFGEDPTRARFLVVEVNGDGRPDLVTGGMHISRPYDRMSRVTVWSNSARSPR